MKLLTYNLDSTENNNSGSKPLKKKTKTLLEGDADYIWNSVIANDNKKYH